MSKPSAEEVAAKNIRKAGYRVYLPRYRKLLRGYSVDQLGRRVRNGQAEIVSRPLFSGYLFAELHPDQMWRPLRTTGVMDSDRFCIMSGERPALLPPELVEEIRAVERSGEFDDPALKKHKDGRRAFFDGELAVKPHDQVRLESGSLAGFVGRLRDMDDAGRVEALVEVFRRLTPVWLPLDDVTPLEAVA